MKTLRMKITLIILGAVLLVVGFATLVVCELAGPPRTEDMMKATAGHIVQIIQLSDRLDGKQRENLGTTTPPDRFAINPYLTKRITNVLKSMGVESAVLVVNNPAGEEKTIYVPVASNSYLVMPFPNIPGRVDFYRVIFTWFGLVGLGSLLVGIALARRATEPFCMLEQAIASVGHDGILPPVAERGNSSTRAMARGLNRLSMRLRVAMESRMGLVAAAGHDLRTPMTRMWLRTEFLPEEDRAIWVKDLEELDRIADSAIRLVREEAGSADREPVALKSLLNETVDELIETGLPVIMDKVDDVLATAGPLALKRALRNLIQNAATHGGGAVVSLEARGSNCRLLIEDNGPGIPEEKLGQVFEPFFRVDLGRRQTIPGAGLGLAIAKEIIERFSGSITIENRAEGGLRQTVAFPLAA